MLSSTFSPAGSRLARVTVVFLGVLLLCFLDGVRAEQISKFKSRPDLYPPVMTIEKSDPDRLSPGYIFLGPYEAENPGPYIYDNDGQLVWSGWGNSGPGNAHAPHVCKYKGTNHLCFFQGNQQKGYCRGHGVILDNRYRIVRSVQAGGGMSSSDMHEFMPIHDGKTALMTIYQQRQFDMSPWNVKSGVGWIMESIFQEVDVESDEVVFEWRSLDHVDPSMGYTYPDHTDTSGDGLDPHSPWDYFHINSIDKNPDGDYLISSRHACAVYKISRQDGSILWTLHGERPSFKNINFSFSQQHDARWLHENSTHTLLSLYNNGYNGFNKTHDFSSGMVILIDHVDQTATQLHDYAPPGRKMLSSSQGNMQVLPNGNIFMGWGNNAYVSEHDEAGNVVLWGYVDNQQKVMNYRAQKFEWDGVPTDVPAMWTFSKAAENDSPTSFYVSWNGATRVRNWKFYGAQNVTGPYASLQTVNKTGFETEYQHPSFYMWSYVEAIDAHGSVLGRSRNKFTFVPSPELRGFCDDLSCQHPQGFGLPGDDKAEAMVPPPGISSVPWIDPEHPYTWPDVTEGEYTSTQAQHYQTIYEYGIWAIPVLIALVAAIGGLLLFRRYRRRTRRRLSRGKEHASPTVRSWNLNGLANGVQGKSGAEGLPWWHWRRWTGMGMEESEEADYIPLTGQQDEG